MRHLGGVAVLILCAAAAMAACETQRPAPYFLVAPSSIAPSVSSSLTRWDSMTELREWVDNPLTKGPFSMRSGDGVEFAQAELRSGVSSLLNGPSLEPVFVRLRGVRVRVRFLASSAGSTAVLNNVDASVAPTLRDDPSNPLIPSYFAKAAATPAVWQILDLLPQRGFGYPAVVDARWLYLTFGRSGDIQVDIDWIELVR